MLQEKFFLMPFKLTVQSLNSKGNSRISCARTRRSYQKKISQSIFRESHQLMPMTPCVGLFFSTTHFILFKERTRAKKSTASNVNYFAVLCAFAMNCFAQAFLGIYHSDHNMNNFSLIN
jgi:hypothetical protein